MQVSLASRVVQGHHPTILRAKILGAVRQYMDVRTRPSHSQMFDKKTGRYLPPSANNVNTTKTATTKIPTLLSIVLSSLIATGTMSYWWNSNIEDESSKSTEKESRA
jgi:hypothetical protein